MPLFGSRILFLVFVTLCGATSGQAQVESISGPGNTLTVGQAAAEGLFPSAVKLVLPKGFGSVFNSAGGCTGTLIAADIVLTAAHCVVNGQGQLMPSVRYGLRKTAQNDAAHEKAFNLSSENVAIKPGAFSLSDGGISFDSSKDLAIIRLPKPVPAAQNRVVPLLKASETNFDRPLVAGWGYQLNASGEPVTGARKLRWADGLKTVSGGLDSARIILKSTVLLNSEAVSVAVCHGDSGGPLYAVRSNSTMADQRLGAVITAYIPSPDLPEELQGSPATLSQADQVRRCAVAGSKSSAIPVRPNAAWITAAIATLQD